MKQSNVYDEVVRRRGMTLRNTSGHSVWHTRWSVVCIGLMVVLVAGGQAAAQTPSATPPVPGRLTVRPHQMATGTQTAQAGLQSLDSLPGYLVYVSTQCVGTRRCPLVVIMSGGGYGAEVVMQMHSQHAEKYGMILLAPDPIKPGTFDVMSHFSNDVANGVGIKMDPTIPYLIREMPDAPDVKNIDAALKQVLRKYAIDPNRIAIGGMSNGGSYSLFLGRNNLDVFSRIAAMSAGIPFRGDGPQNKAAQFFLSSGISEGRSEEVMCFLLNPYRLAPLLRQEGHAVKLVLGLRPHENRVEEHDLMWRWFQESWATPKTAARTAPHAVTDSVPMLTDEVFTKMKTFWRRFMNEPNGISGKGRMAHLKEFTVPVGQERVSLLMSDIPALADKYPTVTADLEKAGLTARQAEAYRLALISARANARAEELTKTVDAASVLGKNIQFLNTHPDELNVLREMGMWNTQ